MKSYLYLSVLLLAVTGCQKKHPEVSIIYNGSAESGDSMSFTTIPALKDARWHFGDSDTGFVSGTEEGAKHKFALPGDYYVSVRGFVGDVDVSTGRQINIADLHAIIAKQYGAKISRVRTWHRTAYSWGAGKSQYTQLADTTFAYKMISESVIHSSIYYSERKGAKVYFNSRYSHPYEYSFSYDTEADQVGFTVGSNGLGGGSNTSYSSF